MRVVPTNYKSQNYKYTGGISYCNFQTSVASKDGGHIGGFYGRILFMKRSIIRYLTAVVYWLICNYLFVINVKHTKYAVNLYESSVHYVSD